MSEKDRILKEMQENDVNVVLFADPFTDETRKVKRNLLAASFITLLIVILQLSIKGNSYFSSASGNIQTELASGIALVAAIYFLISFLIHAYVDYVAWQYVREKLFIKPYVEFVKLHYQEMSLVGDRILAMLDSIKEIREKALKHGLELPISRLADETINKDHQLNKSFIEIQKQNASLIEYFEDTISKIRRNQTWRFRARMLSLWLVDIGFPVFLFLLAFYKGYGGIGVLYCKVVN